VSFRDDEIAEEFESASMMGREYFDSSGYTFRRLGRLERDDFERLADRLKSLKWYRANRDYAIQLNRAWKAAHPERCREHKAASLARLMKKSPDAVRANRRRWKATYRSSPEVRARERAQQRAAYHAKKSPDSMKRAAARAGTWYAKAKADPAKIEALRAYKREWARKKAAAAKAVTP
jgi:hypothetical protein